MRPSLVARVTVPVVAIVALSLAAWLAIVHRSSALTFVDVQSEMRVDRGSGTVPAETIEAIERAWDGGGWDAVDRLARATGSANGADQEGFLVTIPAEQRIASTRHADPTATSVREDDGSLAIALVEHTNGRTAAVDIVDASPTPLVDAAGVRWGYAVALPATPASADVSRPAEGAGNGSAFAWRLWQSAAVWIAVTSVGAMIAIALVLRRSLAPIDRLTSAARALERGDTPARIPVPSASELRGLVEAFNEAAESLAGTERLRRQVIADVGHELRTPVTNLRAQVDAMRQGLVSLDDRALVSLQTELRQLERIADDFQQLAVADAGRLHVNPQPWPLRETLTAILTSLAMPADARWQVEGPPEVVAVVDEDRLQQVVRNLTDNAVHHRPEALAITVRVHPAEAGRCAFTFGDNGPGVSDADVPHIFERFYRAQGQQTHLAAGSGLGLAIARGLIEAMDGTIVYVTEPNAGATFLVTLPSASGNAQSMTAD